MRTGHLRAQFAVVHHLGEGDSRRIEELMARKIGMVLMEPAERIRSEPQILPWLTCGV